MDRDVDPGTYEPNFADPAANRWTDYAGVIPWGDFALSFSGGKPVTSEKVRYLGTAAHQKVSDGSKQYYHGDLIDSVWLTTDGDATPVASVAYTAFGELLDSSGSPGGHGPSLGGGPPPCGGGASPGGGASLGDGPSLGGQGPRPGPPSGFGRYQYAGGWATSPPRAWASPAPRAG